MSKNKVGVNRSVEPRFEKFDPSKYEGYDIIPEWGIEPTPEQVATEQPLDRTWTQAAGDTVLDAVKSTLVVPSTIGGLYGYATGDADNYLSKNSDRSREILEKAQSDALNQDRKSRQAKIDKADGVVDELTTAFGETVSNPRLAASMLAENLGSLATMGGIGAAAKLAMAGRGLKAAQAAGPISDTASKAILDGAAKVGTRTAVGVGSVMQGADVANDVYKSSMAKPDAAWAQNPDFVKAVATTDGSPEAIKGVKHDLSLSAMRMALPIAAVASAGMNSLPGGDAIERLLVGNVAKGVGKGGIMAGVKAGSKAVAGETFSESGEEGLGAFGGNYAKQTFVDPNQNLFEKVGANAGLGAAGGFLMGGPAGVAHGYSAAQGDGSDNAALPLIGAQNPLAPVQQAATQPGSVLSRAAMAGNTPPITPNNTPPISGNTPPIVVNTPPITGNTPPIAGNNTPPITPSGSSPVTPVDEFSQEWNEDDVPPNASGNNQSADAAAEEYRKATIAHQANTPTDELLLQLDDQQKKDLQHLVGLAEASEQYAHDEAAVWAEQNPLLYGHFPRLLDAQLKAAQTSAGQSSQLDAVTPTEQPAAPSTDAEKITEGIEANDATPIAQPILPESPSIDTNTTSSGLGLRGAVQYGRSAQSGATPANPVDNLGGSAGVPAPSAVTPSPVQDEIGEYAFPFPSAINPMHEVLLDGKEVRRRANIRSGDTITDSPEGIGQNLHPESAMLQLSYHVAATNKLNGQLNSGNSTGATSRGLLSAWESANRLRHEITASRQESPDMWDAYDQRQSALQRLQVGDSVFDAHRSPEQPNGTQGIIGKKNAKNWTINYADGTSELRLPASLRPVDAPIAQPVQPQGETNGNQAPQAVQAKTQGQKTAEAGVNEQRKTVIHTPTNKYDAQWDVVEADSVQASLKEGKSQPRDRSRASSQGQIRSIAENLDFDRLSDSSKSMTEGSPTLSSDGLIVGGNGRYEGISLAYENGKAEGYRNSLIASAQRFGLDSAAIASMKKPVLIRRVAEGADTRTLAIESNQFSGLQMSSMEQAQLDAERMTGLDGIDVSETGAIPMTERNAKAIANALQNYTQAEYAGMASASGELSQDGLRRVRNAILYNAYGKSDALARLIENPEADLRNVSTALVRAASPLAGLGASIKDGNVPAEYSIAEDLTAAIGKLSALRATNTSIDDFLKQIDIFDAGISDAAKFILKFLDANIRSAGAMSGFLSDYARAASSLANQGGLFEQADQPNKLEALSNAATKYAKSTQQQSSIFDAPARPDTQTGATDRLKPEDQGSVTASDSNAPAAQPKVDEPHYEKALALQKEQVAATNNAAQTGKVRVKVRELAKKVQDGTKTAMLLDTIATRLDMGEGRVKGIEFAPAPQEAKATTPSESNKADAPVATTHNGLKIYPIRIKSGDVVKTMWAVQTHENAERAKRGEREIGGDPLADTLEGAKLLADQVIATKKATDENNAAREAEEKAEADKVAADNAAYAASQVGQFIAGNTNYTAMQKGAAKKDLSTLVTFRGKPITKSDLVEQLVAEGYEPTAELENKVQPMTRQAFNQANQQEQDAHAARVKEGGKVANFYLAKGDHSYPIGIHQSDYAQYLLGQNDELDAETRYYENKAAQPKQQPAPTPKPEAKAAVPKAVQDQVKWAITQLRDIESALESVLRARGDGHILALEVKDQEAKLARPNEILNEFREHAKKNGIDAKAVIDALGGEPDLARFSKEVKQPEANDDTAKQSVQSESKLVQDFVDGKTNEPPSVDAVKAEMDAVKAVPLDAQAKAAKAKMLGALGKLANLASKNTRMNWTPEEEQQLLPIVIELFDGAMELGYVTFQKAARYVREFIESGIDKATADSIPFETMQGAYISNTSRHKDKAVTPIMKVAQVTGWDDIYKDDESATTPAEAPVAENNDLPEGWTEAKAGGLATNQDPENGGIVDTALTYTPDGLKEGKWFAIHNKYGKIKDDLDTRADAIAAIANYVPEQKPVSPTQVTLTPLVQHTTAKGKVLTGVIRTDITLDQAKTIDNYAFKKNGGVFVREQYLDALNKAFPPATPSSVTIDVKPSLSNPAGRIAVSKAVADHLMGDNNFATIIQARQFITALTGEKIEAGTELAKRADEAVELGGVIAAREIVAGARKAGRSDAVIFDRLLNISKLMPSLNVRDSDSLRQQAYSTPLPLAFVASRLAKVSADKLVGEPTAGNGALVMEANPKTAVVNELNVNRLEALKSTGFSPSNNDAATMQFEPNTLDSMVMNPPFGSVKLSDGALTRWVINGLPTTQIDHAIVMNSLEAMKNDGNAVLIIGGTLARNNTEEAKQHYRNNTKFFFNLYVNYNVVDHFSVDGKLYGQQGASYPVDVIVIRGRLQGEGASARALPQAELPQNVDTWEQLKEKLNEQNSVVTPKQPSIGGDTVNEGAKTGQRPVPLDAIRPPDQTSTGGAGGSGAGIRPADGSGITESTDRPDGASGETDATVQRRNDHASVPHGRTGGNATQQRGGRRPGSNGSRTEHKPAGVGDGSSSNNGLTKQDNGEVPLQVPYENFSGNKSVNTLVATNHLSAIKNAFERLMRRLGISSIDDYVRKELQYDPELFEASFSAEQVEALALAIDNIKRGKGFIIGDQTGIGKGRVVAAMIRYAKLNGKMPVFVTQMPDLFGDMMRDLNDIGMGSIRPLMTNNGASVPLDAEALEWYSEKQGIQSRIAELQEEVDRLAFDEMGAVLTIDSEAARLKAIRNAAKKSTDSEIISLLEEIAELRDEIPARRGKFLDTPALEIHEAALASMVNKRSIGDHDVIFTTYNQLAALDSGEPRKLKDGTKTAQKAPEFGFRNEFLDHFVDKNAMLILDESHNAGVLDANPRSVKLGNRVRRLIDKAGSVFYSSATFAKNTGMMDAYNKTDLGIAFQNPAAITSAINSVPMQQVASAMLVEAGQYLRRERSFAGIDYETKDVEVSKEDAEDLATSMRLMVAFDAAKQQAIDTIQDDLDKSGAVIAAVQGGGSQASVDSVNFTSVMHNVVNTFLLALKADATAQMAIDALSRGEKPIITVANTMETFITEYAKDTGVGIGESFDATYADVLRKYLEKTRYAKIKSPNGQEERVYLSDDQLGEYGVDAYNEALDFIDSLNLEVPISPIDHIKQKVEDAGYTIGEITGRQTVLVGGKLRLRNKSEQKTAGKKNTISKFNNGGLDALIINRSGSTGLSMHASEKFDDQRRRVMVIGQAELDINNHMQMLGRINRTGQVTEGPFDDDAPVRKASFASRARAKRSKVERLNTLRQDANANVFGGLTTVEKMSRWARRAVGEFNLANLPSIPAAVATDKQRFYKGKPASYGLPHYYQMTADVPIELRPAAVLANKMAALNANTTAGRKSAVQAGSLDFMNKYGDRVATEFLLSNWAINGKLGSPLYVSPSGEYDSANMMTRLTGRIGLMALADQTAIYDVLTKEYGELIAQLDALGQNDLEAKTYPLDARTISTTVVIEKSGDDSPFTGAVNAIVVDVKKLGRPYSKEKVKELALKTLAGKTQKEHHQSVLDNYQSRYAAEIQTLKAAANDSNETAERRAAAQKRITNLVAARLRFMDVLPVVGKTYVLKTENGNYYGAVTDVIQSASSNSVGVLSAWRVRIAIVDGAKSMTIPFSQIYTQDGAKVPDNAVVMQEKDSMMVVTEDRTSFESVPISDAFDRAQTGRRENRIILTGNLLRATDSGLGGRLLNYTDTEGVVQQGVMLDATETMATVESNFVPELTTMESVLSVINGGGSVIDKTKAGGWLKIKKARNGGIDIYLSGPVGKRLVKDYQGLYFASSGNHMVAQISPYSDDPTKELAAFLNVAMQKFRLIPDASTVAEMKAAAKDAKNVRFSRGKSADQTDTPQFKQWFGDSKVVDENGKPLVVYHGTILHKGQGGIGDITAFDRLFTTKIRGASIDTVGSWFSTNSGDGGAEMYSGNSSGSAIYPVHLSIQNPHVTTFQQMERHARKLANGKDDGRRIGKTEVDAYRNWLKSMGKDGIKIEASGNEGSTEFDNQVAWIALEPTQVKSSVGNNGNFDATNSDIRMSRGNFFYSALSKGIEGMATKQAMAGAWAMQLQGLVKKGAVKQSEIEWSGVTDWLKLQEGKVTKEQITAYLDANGVQVEEVVLGDKSKVSVMNDYKEAMKAQGVNARDADHMWQAMMSFSLRERHNKDLMVRGFEYVMKDGRFTGNEIHDANSNASKTKYSDSKLQLPGGTNYREVLLTLPSKEATKSLSPSEYFASLGFDSEKFNAASQSKRDELWMRYNNNQNSAYRSKHWNQPNVLAHVRLNDRIDADGKRVLFVEEVQSDWGQEGKKNGFQGVIPSNVLQAAIKGGMDEAQARSDISALLENPRSTDTRDTSPMWDRLYAATNGSGIDLNEEFHDKRADKTPIAPFVTTTDGWLNLGLKAIVKMAVDGSYDKVAFVNGEQSADRYDLSKRISKIEMRGEIEHAIIRAYDINGQVAIEDKPVKSARELEALIGKDAAENLLDKTPIAGVGGKIKYREINGEGLKIGGSGMEAFYDKIVPNTVNALLKKVGGGRMEQVDVNGESKYPRHFQSEKAAQEWAEANLGDHDFSVRGLSESYGTYAVYDEYTHKYIPDGKMHQQTGFTITDAMRKQASGGLPLFSKGGKAKGIPLVQVREIVDVIRSQWGNAPNVVVAMNMNDPIIPQAVRDADKHQRSQGAKGAAEGFVYGGKTYLVASELNTPTDVLRVLFHEALGHLGLRGVFGKSLEQVLNQVILGRRKEVLAKVKEYGLDANNKDDLLEAAEEVLAQMAQTRPELGFVQRAIAAIRNFLRTHVPFFADLELTDADIIQQYLLPARAYITNGISRDASGSAGTMPSNNQSFSNKFSSDAATSNSKVFRNLTDSESFRKEGFSSLNVPQQRQVLSRMLTLLHDGKILNSVIRFLPIDMVNMFTGEKFSTKMALNDKAVLKHLLTIPNGNKPIPIGGQSATTFIQAIADVTANHGASYSLGQNSLAGLSAISARKVDSLGLVNSRPASGAATNQSINRILDARGGDIEFSGAVATIDDRHFATPTSDDVLGAGGVDASLAPSILRDTVENTSFILPARRFVENGGGGGGGGRKTAFSLKDKQQSVSGLNAAIEAQEGVSSAFALDSQIDKGMTDVFAKVFGANIIPIKANSSESIGFAAMNFNGSLYVNASHPRYSFSALAGHELLHQLKLDNRPLYDHFEAVAHKRAVGGIGNALHAYGVHPENQGYAQSDLSEELLGDFVGDALSDAAFLEQMAKDEPTKFRQFANYVINWLDGVASKMTGTGFGSSQYFTDVQGMRNELAKVLAEYSDSKAGKKPLLAPNGKPSKLTEGQWHQVRTPQFKAWFGDSTAVDENGEPMVFYHGTSSDKDIAKFKMPKNGAWFTAQPDSASDYAKDNDSKGLKYNPNTRTYDEVNNSPRVMPVFLNIRNEHQLTPDEKKMMNVENYKSAQGRMFDGMRQTGVDGVRVSADELVVIQSPTQIKSAIGNNGDFDPNNADIRFSRKTRTMYHGSPSGDIQEFHADENGLIFMSPDRETADGYAGAIGRSKDAAGHKQTVYELKVAANNTLDFDNLPPHDGSAWQELLSDVINYPEDGGGYRDNSRVEWKDVEEFGGAKLFQAIKDAGYDSIEHSYIHNGEAQREFAVFDGTQIEVVEHPKRDSDASADIRFSRGAIANAKDSIAAAREINIGLGYKLGDLFKSTAKTSLWNRTVGTQYHLAEKSPEFKRTFDAVQNFLSDTSIFANKAADLAPNMLPKMDSIKDFTKRALSSNDVQSASEAIFEGTLNWARDGAGNLVRHEDMLEAANQMTAEDKARQLLRANKMHPKTLQMWQGLPIEQYEAIINSKYERDMLQAGVVFTPSELKSIFLLTGDLQQDGSYSGQIGLYQEFRKSTDQSLKDLASSEMVRMGGTDLYPIADAVMDAGSVGEAHGVIEEYLKSVADPDRAEELQSTIDSTRDIADKAINLMRNGYAPLSRFGKYAVYATSPTGEQLYFGMYETQREANKAERGLRDAMPTATIQSGLMSQEQHKLFEGVSPETLAIFGESMGLDAEKGALYQEYIKLVASSRSSMRRMLKRKGVDGYSEDATRVLAGFVSSNARKVASNLNKYEIEQSANKIKAGDVKDAAIKLKEYVQNPMEEAQWIRGMLFTQYIGGSVASAIINMTQPLTMTMPYLSQFAGVNAPKRIAEAMIMAAKGVKGDDDLAKALKRAEDDGTVSPQEIHQLQAQAMGRSGLQSGDGTRTGDALAMGNNALSRFSLAWGRLFGAAEEFNRRATFIAAYKIAREKPQLGDAFEFAEKAIKETQGIYNKGNKPAWARGAIGGVLFTFKQFSISYVEFLMRMYGNGTEGKQAVLFALGVLVLTAGINGLPGGDDLDDLIDGTLQTLGYNFSSKQAKREFLTNALGSPAAAQFVMHGFTGLPGAPIDVSGRMGLGNLIPGTGLMVRKDDHTRDVVEFLGPIADLATRAYESGGMALRGEFVDAALNLTPVAVRNAAKGADMAETGMYRDKLNRNVIAVDMGDAAVKSIGFQPGHVAQHQQSTMLVQKMVSNARHVESEIARDFALGRFERNQSKMDAARQRLIDWNRKNPSSPIRVTVQQVNQLVQNMNKTKAQRMSASAPKELRAAVRRELAASDAN